MHFSSGFGLVELETLLEGSIPIHQLAETPGTLNKLIASLFVDSKRPAKQGGKFAFAEFSVTAAPARTAVREFALGALRLGRAALEGRLQKAGL